jgi:hypothetical protein
VPTKHKKNKNKNKQTKKPTDFQVESPRESAGRLGIDNSLALREFQLHSVPLSGRQGTAFHHDFKLMVFRYC